MSTVYYLNFAIDFIEGSGLGPKIFMFRYMKGDILLMAEAFESLSTYTQCTVRKYILFVHGKLITEVIKECGQLWNYDLFGAKDEKALRQKMEFCIKMTKALAMASSGTIALLCLTAIFDEKKSVPLTCWTPDSKLATGIIFSLEVLTLLETLYLVVALDSFYLLICTAITVQFIMLQKMLEQLNFGVNSDDELHKKLNKIYSEYYIVQYVITVTAVAIQGYIVLYKSTSLQTSIKGVVYFFTVMFQVALFFIPASNIEIEAENFSNEIYNVNWEDNRNMKNGKHILFMLMKSQKPLYMLGGGMLHVNRNEYIVLLRLAFTIATILGGMK
ncbi:odorant receptor 22a-like [Asbolus verrucosus]|uniref:Odorant receptor 22a-like n=1 Tax=Asbolus verrucosus TaxID=1661398 RepID=A0A482VG15_ASBVE|nr:odorant receptor 22a-like [Asbolus verrucosus]